MESVCVCSGHAWRVELRTDDADIREWIDRLRFDPDCEEADEPTWVRREGVWLLTRPRQYATDEDPLVDVLVERRGTAGATITGTLGARTTVVSNTNGPAPSDAGWSSGDHVRLASPQETVELALRWLLGWGHLGCVDLDDFAFWETRTVSTAYVVDDVERWRADRTPLPFSGAGDDAAFVALDITSFALAREVFESAAQRAGPDGGVGGGIYGDDRARALVAVANGELEGV